MTPRVLITGGSSGIGSAFAARLARDGHDLLLLARRGDRLQALANDLATEHGVRVEFQVVDLSVEEGIAAAEQLVRDSSPLQMLINNAGFGTRGHFVDVAAHKLLAQTRLQVLAPMRLAHAALGPMIHRGQGAVINVSSLSSFFPARHYASYSATKAYLNALTLALHEELAGSGVQVQAVCAGLTRTEFLDSAEFSDFNFNSAPSWTWMTPEQVVEQSLAALGHGSPLFVPGLHNRALVRAMHTPGLRWLLAQAVQRAGIEY